MSKSKSNVFLLNLAEYHRISLDTGNGPEAKSDYFSWTYVQTLNCMDPKRFEIDGSFFSYKKNWETSDFSS